MKINAIPILLLFAPVGTSYAHDIGGKYKMEGIDPGGARYVGTAEIQLVTDASCRIVFSDGFAGICLLKQNNLAVAYDVHGKLGVALYDITEGGLLKGQYVDDFHFGGVNKNRKLGSETLTPMP